MPDGPDVRIGVVSWNTAALLDGCLAALPAALGDLSAEVVVVDNASTDDSVEVAGRHQRTGVQVIVNRANEGYGRAMNQALAGTTAPVLVALNPDTVPPPGSLATLVAALHQRPQAGVVAPRLVHVDGRPQHSAYRFPSLGLAAVVCFTPPRAQRGRWGTRWRLEAAAAPDPPGPVDWVIGAVHVVRRDALAGAPPYSERWFMYAEDIELCWRLADAGWQTELVVDVAVPHVGNAAGAQAWGTERDRRWWGASYDLYARRRGRGAMRRWAAVNATGAVVHLVAQRLGALGSGAARARRRRVAAELRAVLPVHRAALRGPERAVAVAGTVVRPDPDAQAEPA
jgi:N-acetylglucosaminyl-diphospho-decaprenol L-rhamnosyltransferase